MSSKFYLNENQPSTDKETPGNYQNIIKMINIFTKYIVLPLKKVYNIEKGKE